ncbi:hypothetical protein M5689_021008 [Euphorbia peplus]|nr:hypothetical protein M5689_021008 [Euphorbia peplus]
MSITLRDILALTHLPIFGEEVPSLILTKAFPKFMSINGGYSSIINHFAVIKLDGVNETDADYNHLHFVWVLLCKFVFFPNCGKPTLDILPLAKHLASGSSVALGKMLLGSIFHHLHETVTKDPFTKLGGCVWIVQLWLFSYFPALRSGGSLVDGFAGMRVSPCECTLGYRDALSFFFNLKMATKDYFIFHENQLDLPLLARTYYNGSATPEGNNLWLTFLKPISLHVGARIKTKGQGVYPCLESYVPLFWSRQFGLTQLKTNVPQTWLSNRNPKNKHEVLAHLKLSKTPALASIVVHCPFSAEVAHTEFETNWRLTFETLLPENPGSFLKSPFSHQKRKKQQKAAPLAKKAKKDLLPKLRSQPTRKSGRILKQSKALILLPTEKVTIDLETEQSQDEDSEKDQEGSDEESSNKQQGITDNEVESEEEGEENNDEDNEDGADQEKDDDGSESDDSEESTDEENTDEDEHINQVDQDDATRQKSASGIPTSPLFP